MFSKSANPFDLLQKSTIRAMFKVKSVDPKTHSPPSRNERLVTNEVTTGTSQSFMLLFCLLDDRIASPTSFCFLSRKTPHYYWNNSYLNWNWWGIRDSWHDVTTHSETQTPFYTDTRSSWLGVAEAGTLKLDLRALKCQNPIFCLGIPFTHRHATSFGKEDCMTTPNEGCESK